MPIGVSYFGSKRPAPGVNPQRSYRLPDSMPPDALPFNKKNPVDWNTGKHLVQFEPEAAAAAAEDEEVLPPENPKILGGDGGTGPLGEGSTDDALADTYDPTEADQDGVSVWLLCRGKYDHEGSMILYDYYRKFTWPKAIAPVISAETRVLKEEPVEL
jgi:hypothetical protein